MSKDWDNPRPPSTNAGIPDELPKGKWIHDYAFPHSFEKTGHPKWSESTGMSLRDYFAGQALHGLCASMIANEDWEEIDVHKVAKYAYGFADFMLKERVK